MAAYRYTDWSTIKPPGGPDDAPGVSAEFPLRRCRSCNRDLTEEGAVCITLAIADQTVDVPSRLDADGNLIDTQTADVAAGHHSETCCNHCGVSLIEYERLIEDDKPDDKFADMDEEDILDTIGIGYTNTLVREFVDANYYGDYLDWLRDRARKIMKERNDDA